MEHFAGKTNMLIQRDGKQYIMGTSIDIQDILTMMECNKSIDEIVEFYETKGYLLKSDQVERAINEVLKEAK